jgi:hypothetical protein
MAPFSVRQLLAAAAVAATVLVVVGAVIPGKPPAFDAAPQKIVAYFRDNHKAQLAGTVLIELGVAFLVALIAQLALLLRDVGQRAHAAAVGIAGAASLGTLAVGAGLYGGLAQIATFSREATAAAPLYRLIQFLQVAWAWTTLMVVLAVAHAAWKGAFARWIAGVNGIIAILLVLAGLCVKGRGVFAAGTGAFCAIGSIAFLVWVLHLGMLFWREPRPLAPAAAP